MTYLFSIPDDFVFPIAIGLIVIPLVLSLLGYWLSRTNKSSEIFRNASKFFITPFPIEPLHEELSDTSVISEMKNRFTRQVSYRTLLIYGGIFLFILGNLFGEFYSILADISLPITQGSTGDTRIWSSFVFDSPFSGGWMGSLPWYGDFPLPLMTLDTYHETWSWIFFTSTFTDNPAFLDSIVFLIILGSAVSGLLFLIPLFFSVIRKSFVPSIFFFSTGMLISMKSIFSCFIQSLRLELASGSITYGIHTIINKDMVNVTNLLESFILPLLFIILIMFGLFILLGRRIWRQHYPNHRYSHYWFMLYITLSFWGSLVILLV